MLSTRATRLSLPALAVALALPLTMTGACSSTTTKSPRDPMVSTEVVNASAHTVRVSLHIGDRVRLEGRPVLPRQDGKPVEIARGQSEALRIRRPRDMVLWGAKPDDELVYWLRTEIVTASWDDEAVFW